MSEPVRVSVLALEWVLEQVFLWFQASVLAWVERQQLDLAPDQAGSLSFAVDQGQKTPWLVNRRLRLKPRLIHWHLQRLPNVVLLRFLVLQPSTVERLQPDWQQNHESKLVLGYLWFPLLQKKSFVKAPCFRWGYNLLPTVPFQNWLPVDAYSS